MRTRRFWRTLLAGALIGVVEAVAPERQRSLLRRPHRIVWIDDREPEDRLARSGVWFLDPLGDPRPRPGDLRRETGPALRLAALPARLIRAFTQDRS